MLISTTKTTKNKKGLPLVRQPKTYHILYNNSNEQKQHSD